MPPGRTLAILQKAAATPGHSQQHRQSCKGKPRTALHARENASSIFNEASTLIVWEFVKAKKALMREERK
jgi:hypothetical protein